jgi:mannosyltransferase
MQAPLKIAAPTGPHSSAYRVGETGRHWAVIGGIALLALALRIYQLGAESLWTDEWLSLGDADHLNVTNFHRPLFYFVLHRWCRLLSITNLFYRGDALLRLPAVFFGVAAVVLLYLIGRRLAGASAAAVACLIMTIAVPELDHSQEVRMYTMASALTLASVYALMRWIEIDRLWILGLHVLLTYLGFLTSPTVMFGLLLAAAMAEFYLLHRRKLRAAASMLVGYALLLGAWWPLRQYASMAIKVGHLNWIPVPVKTALLSLHNELLTEGLGNVRGFHASQLLQTGVCVLVLSLIATALVAFYRQESGARSAGCLAAWFYTIAGAAYATSMLGQPVWVLRYFHYSAPALYLLLGIGLVSLWRWRQPVGGLIGIALLGSISVAAADYYRLPVHEDWRAAGSIVGEDAKPGDLVAIAGFQQLFTRYYHGAVEVSQVAPAVSDGTEQPDSMFDDLLAQIPAHSGRTWIVVREDPRFERVGYLQRLNQYLRGRGANPRLHVVRATQGQLDVVDFGPQPTGATAAASPN